MFYIISTLVGLGILFVIAALIITFTSRTIKVDSSAAVCMDIGVIILIIAAVLQLTTS